MKHICSPKQDKTIFTRAKKNIYYFIKSLFEKKEKKNQYEREKRARVSEGSGKQAGQVLTMLMKRMTDGEFLRRSLCG